MHESTAGIMLTIGYILVGLSAGGVVVFSILQLVQNIKKGIVTLISIAALALIFIINLGIVGEAEATSEFSATYVRFSSAALNTFYVLAAMAVLSIVVGELRGAIVKR